jgi:homoserine kinase
VPGSTSNLGPGFDCLGLALDLLLHVDVTVRPDDRLHIDVRGKEARGVPTDAGNLTYQAIARVLERNGKPLPGLALRICNDIPVGRGLGSSAAAIVAGVVAGTLLAGREPRTDEILDHAARLEGHPDNAAPAVHGGLVAAARLEDAVRVVRLPLPALRLLLLIPDLEVPTESARRILPATVTRDAAVFNLQRLALLLGALFHADRSLLRDAMTDRLHEAERLGLVPGLARARELLRAESGCLAALVSGSGPTLLGLFGRIPRGAGSAAVATLARHGIQARLRRVRPRDRGAAWRIVQSA